MVASAWGPAQALPLNHLSGLSRLTFPADGLLMPPLATSFALALSRLPQLQELQLLRLQLSAETSRHVGLALGSCSELVRLQLTGGSMPLAPSDLHALLWGIQLKPLSVAGEDAGKRGTMRMSMLLGVWHGVKCARMGCK